VVQAAKLAAGPAGHDYELWALPKGGSPVSLGVLPAVGASSRTLSAIQKQALASSSQVAVSIEPPGGSPTGQPTGDIVFVAPLRAIS
jgi:anti-sigma-K factor RskA